MVFLLFEQKDSLPHGATAAAADRSSREILQVRLVSSDLHFELSSGFISALWASSQTPNFHG